MTIVSFLESDIPQALALSVQAGWNHTAADYHRLLALWPAGCLAGRIDGRIVATTTLASLTPHVGWVGLVLVDEAFRRQGLGGQMLDAMLVLAEQMGIKTLGLDATELGLPLYLARGFRDVGTVDRWIRPASPAPGATPTASDNDSPPDGAAWKELLAMDLRATRLDRSSLLNHFRSEREVVLHLLRDPSTSRMQAYAFARPGRLASHIAPLIADSPSAAETLLTELLHHLDTTSNTPTQIDVPSGRLSTWLTAHGFSLSRSVIRMQAGFRGPDLLGPKAFAGCGFELG